MKNKSIIFMGTPDFAVESLKSLVENNYNVIGVITSIDKQRGRGRKKTFSPVKKYALNKGINIFQPPNLKDHNFINLIKNKNPNLFVVVAFRMLPEILIKIPDYGCINLHSSLLPDYRGAAPINWVLINGEKKTGVTTFFINNKIDQGDIINNKKIKIENNETAGTLHDKLMYLGSNLILETVNDIFNENVKRTKQNISEKKNYAPKIQKKTCIIDFNKTSENIIRLINGLSPYPGARIFHNDKLVKILKARKSNAIENNFTELFEFNNKIYLNNNLGESIEILELQFEGKIIMNSSEFLRGNKL